MVGQVLTGSAAERAGLRPRDRIVSVDGQPIKDWETLVGLISRAPGRSLSVHVIGATGDRTLNVVPEAQSVHGQTIGRIGIGVADDLNLHEKLFTVVLRSGRCAAAGLPPDLGDDGAVAQNVWPDDHRRAVATQYQWPGDDCRLRGPVCPSGLGSVFTFCRTCQH